jgi:hypothetical protein
MSSDKPISGDINRLMDTVFHDLGYNDDSMRRDRPYNGQPHTDTGERGKTEIKGITFRDLRDCFIRAVFLSTGAEGFPAARTLYDEANKGEDGMISANDLYGWDLDKLDPLAISQNLACEVEKIMGIYPNVPELRDTSAEG